MSRLKNRFASEAHTAADLLLREISYSRENIAQLEKDLEAELDRLKAASPLWQSLKGDLLYHQERLRQQDQELRGLMDKNQAEFFPLPGPLGSCSVDLPHGTLLYDKTDYVVKPRKVSVLDNLLKYGFMEAVRVNLAVDWDALADKEEWSGEALGIIGTRRETKETYAYDLLDKESKP